MGYDVEADREALHRLCPRYAQDVNSPLRHVRTRIYFTSESHMHSLLNVLRFCTLGRDEVGVNGGLVSEEAHSKLRHDTPELDYMTHIVFRMYENKKEPVTSPERFRIEILFSPGASHDPFLLVASEEGPHIPRLPPLRSPTKVGAYGIRALPQP
eukprot:jgi/Botrbrau1/13442/Bobra.0082s0046.1